MATATRRTSRASTPAVKGNGAPNGGNGAAATEQTLAAVQIPSRSVGETPPAPPDFTSAIYDAITKMFASRNPTQLFCLSWPGTVLDYDELKWEQFEEEGGRMPESALVRSSQILDQYVPPAPITQPDGTRVSDRYAQALSQYGPVPNPALIQLQDIIRNRLQALVVREIDGRERTFSLAAWFDYLYSQWTDAKRAWGEKQLAEQGRLKAEYADDPNRDAWWNAYLQWYGNNATAYVGKINSRWQQLVAEFPLTEWEDAIAILDTRDNVGIEDARLILDNETRPLPYQEGVDYVPTFGVPYDWPLECKPVTKFLDLLADPEAQQMAYETALTQLEQEVFNWMAIVPQIDDADVQRSAEGVSSATKAYSQAQSELMKQYTRNTVEAVKMFCDIMEARGNPLGSITDVLEQKQITDDVNETGKDLAEGNKLPFQQVDWAQIKDIASKLGEGQESLIERQQALIDAGFELADAAQKFLSDKSRQSMYGWLNGYIEQLRGKLETFRRQAENHSSASNVWFKYRDTAKTTPEQPDPNRSSEFGADSFPSPLDSPANDRWTLVEATVSTKQLEASTTMNTSFSQLQWGVNLFFGSAGGSYQDSKSDFASKFMQSESSIQIGFLATKVIIDRPWMKPELFGATRNMFRTTHKPVSPDKQITAQELIGPDGGHVIEELINEYSFPCYPVALLLAKDVTVRVQIKFDQMEEMRDYAKSVKSQGGGFLCFSVSRTESSESQSESTNEYCMAGQFVAKAPAPQIIGYWVQMLPPDESRVLTPDDAAEIARSLGFVTKLRETHSGSGASSEPVRL